MIKHIVFFGLAENAEGKTKEENAKIIKSELENLIHLIPEIKAYRTLFYINENPADDIEILKENIEKIRDGGMLFQQSELNQKFCEAFKGKKGVTIN